MFALHGVSSLRAHYNNRQNMARSCNGASRAAMLGPTSTASGVSAIFGAALYHFVYGNFSIVETEPEFEVAKKEESIGWLD